MLKKMMLLALSAGALLAFAAPAAQAKVTLQEADGTKVFPGAEVTATSSNTVVTINGGNSFKCAKVTWHGIVIGVNPTTPKGIVWGSVTTSNCTVNGVVPMTITESEIEMEYEEGGGGTAAFAFEYDVPLLGFNNCVEEASAISINWTAETDEIHMAGGPLLGTGSGCPAGAEAIHGVLQLETSNGEPVFQFP